MSSFPYFPSDNPGEAANLRRNWGWALALGVVLMLVGLLAIAYPAAATLTTVELFGYLLVIAGAFEVVGAFRTGRWGGFLPHLLCALLAFFVGVALIDRPLLGAAGYTLVLAVFFVGSGIVRIVFALTDHFSGWGWVLLNGAVTLLLGLLIWKSLPEAAFWVIGTFVGIDLFLNGLSWVMVALAVRSILPPRAAPSDRALAGV